VKLVPDWPCAVSSALIVSGEIRAWPPAAGAAPADVEVDASAWKANKLA
jgi:hypothetical protein